MKRTYVLAMVYVMAAMNVASAETIRGIDIEFVTIGYAGNTVDPYIYNRYGAVGYNYRIGKYEVTNAQWNTFVTAAGVPTGSKSDAYGESALYTDPLQPTNRVSWYEGLQFCNYLTSGDKSKGVYQFSGTNTNPGDFLCINRDAAKTTYKTIYFLPTENEWYKAAYYKSDGSGYSVYANGTGEIPPADQGWNYGGGLYSTPWNVGTGTQEQNGTFDMMGNVWEWSETLINISNCVIRGSTFNNSENTNCRSSQWLYFDPAREEEGVGFRVASTIPERTLSVMLPNGSESIIASTIYTIDWSSDGVISEVLIEYSTNNGQTWNAVSPPNIGNTGSYGWSAPMVASHECLIRISDPANSNVSDISDNVFEIAIPKTITVISPNGGESLISGGEQLIQWSSTGTISGVLIEQSFNNGQNWFPVEPANNGNNGSYEWFVPFANSSECLVRLSDASNPAIYDTSNNVFTISQENPSEYPTLYEVLGGSAPAITESGRDFATRAIPDANVVAFILLESAGFANENIFGIYSADDQKEKLQLFRGSDSFLDSVFIYFDSDTGIAGNLNTGQTANIGSFFGFYLTTPQNGGTTFYTDATRNPDLLEHGLIYNTAGFDGVIENDPDAIIAFEDLLGLGDQDYNDMVVGITNAAVIPGLEPYCMQEIQGDLNHDCKVDLADLAIIMSHWLECNLDPKEACFGESPITPPTSYTLTVNSAGASGVNIGSSTGHDGMTNYAQTLTAGTSISLTAPVVVDGKTFVGWGGDATGSTTMISFILTGNKTITANYAVAEPAGMVWVSINDPGVSGHEGFNGQMSKYETTNAQYCHFLNAAKAANLIMVYTDNIVYATSDTNHSQPYYNPGTGVNYNGATNGGAARINWTGSTFAVDAGFENHPVTHVSWYGSTSFASYYGWRLPTEWEWQAVADYDGSFTYGCGTTITNSMANYCNSIHPNGTTAVGAFGAYGYGMCDMAGNVWEWTSSCYNSDCSYGRVNRGGGWTYDSSDCTVSGRYDEYPYQATGSGNGFRVCR